MPRVQPQSAPPAAATPSNKAPRDRSPSYPFIPLGVAVQRLSELENHFGRHPTPVNKIGAAWGMKEQSSQAGQTVSALRSFGLVNYEGSGTSRQVVVSEEGRTYLRAQQETVKEACLKQAALRPKAIRKFWASWGKDRPVDAVALDTLILQNDFSDSGARAFLKVYDDTISFAKLSTADKVPDGDTEDDDEAADSKPKVEVGDLVQVVIGGSAQYKEPQRVRALQDHGGQPFVFIVGEMAGIPMENVELVQKGGTPPKPPAPTLALEDEKPRSGTRKEVFALDEGDVVLTFPENLSASSFADLEGYFSLFLRKARRRVNAGDFFAEIYEPDGIKAKEVHYFENFADLCGFAEKFKKGGSNLLLRAHLPSRATDDDRRKMAELGIST
jgi:hypothetical protein